VVAIIEQFSEDAHRINSVKMEVPGLTAEAVWLAETVTSLFRFRTSWVIFSARAMTVLFEALLILFGPCKQLLLQYLTQYHVFSFHLISSSLLTPI
jgi:hypothetical protein